MRDWPEPDQDTSLEILDIWDYGDYEEERAERAEAEYYEAQAKAEEQAKADAERQAESDAADWDRYAEVLLEADRAKYEAEIRGIEEIPQWAIDEGENEAAYAKALLWEETRIAQFHADIAQARADIIQAEANIARTMADIAEAEYNMAEGDEDAKAVAANAQIKLADAEVILSNSRTIGAAYEAVVRAKTDVKYAETKVQAKKDAKDLAVEIKVTSEREYHVEESNLLAEGAHVEYIFSPVQQNGIIEIGFCSEDVHIEYVNALIDLAEAQDALDLTEVHLVKTPPLCISRGYGFASNEPSCPFESSLTEHNKRGRNRYANNEL